MKYTLPALLFATPALAHPGALHSHATAADWLAFAGVLAALAAPAAIRALVRARSGK